MVILINKLNKPISLKIQFIFIGVLSVGVKMLSMTLESKPYLLNSRVLMKTGLDLVFYLLIILEILLLVYMLFSDNLKRIKQDIDKQKKIMKEKRYKND